MIGYSFDFIRYNIMKSLLKFAFLNTQMTIDYVEVNSLGPSDEPLDTQVSGSLEYVNIFIPMVKPHVAAIHGHCILFQF